jgi:DNA-binding response OmpR family regulator
MSRTILVVDDERNIVELARMYLRNEGFEIEAAYNGKEALEKARSINPSLVLLDIMMPESDELRVMRALRRRRTSPSSCSPPARTAWTRWWGWSWARDDYITKAFKPAQSWWRASRRCCAAPSQSRKPHSIEVGDLTINVAGREVQVAGKTVPLRTKEFDLLVALAQNAGVAMARPAAGCGLGRGLLRRFAHARRAHRLAARQDRAATAKIVTVWGSATRW